MKQSEVSAVRATLIDKLLVDLRRVRYSLFDVTLYTIQQYILRTGLLWFCNVSLARTKLFGVRNFNSFAIFVHNLFEHVEVGLISNARLVRLIWCVGVRRIDWRWNNNNNINIVDHSTAQCTPRTHSRRVKQHQKTVLCSPKLNDLHAIKWYLFERLRAVVDRFVSSIRGFNSFCHVFCETSTGNFFSNVVFFPVRSFF